MSVDFNSKYFPFRADDDYAEILKLKMRHSSYPQSVSIFIIVLSVLIFWLKFYGSKTEMNNLSDTYLLCLFINEH